MIGILWAVLGNRYALAALAVAGLVTGAYLKGHSDATANCHEATLRTQIEVLKRDLSIAAAAQAAAADRQKALDREKARLEQEVSDYEIWIAANSKDGCALGPADIDRLHRLGH